jgi:predicted RecA/RadA family phage recombinase
MSDTTGRVRGGNEIRKTAAAAVAAGAVNQLADGRAAVYTGQAAAASGDRTNWTTEGQYVFTKATGVLMVDGQRVYWDRSTPAATFRKVNDRDYYLGRLVGDAASADTTCTVNLNVDPEYDLSIEDSPCLSTIVGTAAAGGFGYPVHLGGASILELTATNEAQKVDLMTVDGFAVGANAIVEGEFRVISDGAGSAVDVSIGVANGTHATDADSITESLFIHLDANNTNINVESDDGTTEVAATDSTADYTEGSTKACQVHFVMDMRDPADIQVIVNGALVLGSTVFKLDAATGPLFLLAHVEKTSSTDTYKIAIDRLTARFAEQ